MGGGGGSLEISTTTEDSYMENTQSYTHTNTNWMGAMGDLQQAHKKPQISPTSNFCDAKILILILIFELSCKRYVIHHLSAGDI